MSITTPRMASFSLILESLTATVTWAFRQSRTKRSVPALNIGELVIGFTRVLYTSSSSKDLQGKKASAFLISGDGL